MPFVREVIFGILFVSLCGAIDLNFPPNFKFGSASASYQVEGAWNVSGNEIVGPDLIFPNIISWFGTGGRSHRFWRFSGVETIITSPLAVFNILIYPRTFLNKEFIPGSQFINSRYVILFSNGINLPDKSISIWDKFVHEKPEAISDRSTGDVACDSYNLWQRDIEIAEELGLHFYRFSISWPRLLPNGFANYISKDGQEYYNKLIDGLLLKGIEPLVTIYHWDLPQSLQDLGGWLNPLITDWFADYARVVYSLYGDRVKIWLTLNEPISMCDSVYSTGTSAPPIFLPDNGFYICNKNAMIAHGKAWRIYDEEFRVLYNGEVSLANAYMWFEPLTPDDEDVAEAALQLMGGRYSHPIFSKGGWPPVIEKFVAEASAKKGYNKSNLPAFTEEEIELVRGTFDFLGINQYTSRLVRHAEPDEELLPWPIGDAPDINGKLSVNPDWPAGTSSWFRVHPEGLRKQLVWLKKQYGDIKFLITENGYSSGAGLQDTERVKYYRDHLEQALLAIKEDGVNLIGYTAWTLMDNFEWTDGYQSKFGLYEVDFDSPERTRTPRNSAIYYKNVIKEHRVIEPSDVLGEKM